MVQKSRLLDKEAYLSQGFVSIELLCRRLSHDQLAELATSLGLCLECGGSPIQSNREVVCSQCGLVWMEARGDPHTLPGIQ